MKKEEELINIRNEVAQLYKDWQNNKWSYGASVDYPQAVSECLTIIDKHISRSSSIGRAVDL